MLGYPIVDRNLRRMTRNELAANPLCREVARKAAERGSATQDIVKLTGTIWGTISRRNIPQGLSVDYSATPRRFPDGTGSMSRYGDISRFSEGQLIANIVSGGGPGTILTVTGAGEDISVGLEVITSPPEIVVGTWHPVTAGEAGATLLEWFIEGAGVGTVVVGLCQLKFR